MSYYVGIDASLETVNVCVVDDEGTVCIERKTEAEPEQMSKKDKNGTSKIRHLCGANQGWFNWDSVCGLQHSLMIRFRPQPDSTPSCALRWKQELPSAVGAFLSSQPDELQPPQTPEEAEQRLENAGNRLRELADEARQNQDDN